MNFKTQSSPQCHWVYRTFEDIEDLERNRSADEKEESTLRPYPVQNGSNLETNGTGDDQHLLTMELILLLMLET